MLRGGGRASCWTVLTLEMAGGTAAAGGRAAGGTAACRHPASSRASSVRGRAGLGRGKGCPHLLLLFNICALFYSSDGLICIINRSQTFLLAFWTLSHRRIVVFHFHFSSCISFHCASCPIAAVLRSWLKSTPSL